MDSDKDKYPGGFGLLDRGKYQNSSLGVPRSEGRGVYKTHFNLFRKVEGGNALGLTRYKRRRSPYYDNDEERDPNPEQRRLETPRKSRSRERERYPEQLDLDLSRFNSKRRRSRSYENYKHRDPYIERRSLETPGKSRSRERERYPEQLDLDLSRFNSKRRRSRSYENSKHRDPYPERRSLETPRKSRSRERERYPERLDLDLSSFKSKRRRSRSHEYYKHRDPYPERRRLETPRKSRSRERERYPEQPDYDLSTCNSKRRRSPSYDNYKQRDPYPQRRRHETTRKSRSRVRERYPEQPDNCDHDYKGYRKRLSPSQWSGERESDLFDKFISFLNRVRNSDKPVQSLESLPCCENYAELLTEMLGKRVWYGESLEHYYYAKVNLLNRCNIHGKQAVDCILYGVKDRVVKVAAQAAQFSEPEQVLQYFRTVKVGKIRDRDPIDRDNDRRSQGAHRAGTSKENTGNVNKICYNCNGLGHRSSKCGKPAAKCTYCERLGHLEGYCFRKKGNKFQQRDKKQIDAEQGRIKTEYQVAAGTSKENIENVNKICHNCNGLGHRSSKCGKPAAKCTYCEGLGHLEEHCLKKNGNKSQQREEERITTEHRSINTENPVATYGPWQL